MEEDADPREQDFHNTVREYIIFFLFFILLNLSSYLIIRAYKRKEKDEFCADDEDATVYRISLWMCTFSLGVSIGAALLLPISIISNEVLLLYPDSYYVKWLNSSLIQGLWNHIFLFSNVSLFLLLPFAYLFTESEGFAGSRKGIMARVYETFVVLMLLFLVVLGMTYILSALIDHGKSSLDSLFSLWSYYLPFLYSCISFLGALMLLVCTPLGFARLFTIAGHLVHKPQFLRDLEDDYYVAKFEEESLKRKLKIIETSASKVINGVSELKRNLVNMEQTTAFLDKQRHASVFQSYIIYPLVMLLLFALTIIAVVVVAHNSLQLLIGIKALPLSTQQFTLGISSLSSLGPIGAALEIILILYLILTSGVGFYTLPYFSKLQPRLYNTPMIYVIMNCAAVLILSSAVPLLSRALGITNFDLLGDFGRIEWLGNFFVIFFYNAIFMIVLATSMIIKFTTTVQRELKVWCDLMKNWPLINVLRPPLPLSNGAAVNYPKDD